MQALQKLLARAHNQKPYNNFSHQRNLRETLSRTPELSGSYQSSDEHLLTQILPNTQPASLFKKHLATTLMTWTTMLSGWCRLHWIQGLIVSAAVVGAAIGSAVGGFWADKKGCKAALSLADILFALGALVMAFAPDAAILIIGERSAQLACVTESNLPSSSHKVSAISMTAPLHQHAFWPFSQTQARGVCTCGVLSGPL